MRNQDLALLENPIWSALRTDHASLAEGDDRARRYPAAIGPLAGMRDASAESFESLRPLAEHPVVLFCPAPPPIPQGWTELRNGPLIQMIRTAGSTTIVGAPSMDAVSPRPWVGDTKADSPSNASTLRQLTSADAPAMVALAELTEPGPFRLRTMELGNFYGIFHGDQLMAMAGKRTHMPGFVEVSGVCTHPDARGRGYARTLMQIVIDEIEQEGRTPILHSWAANHSAIRLYESLGFSLSRRFHLAVLKAES